MGFSGLWVFVGCRVDFVAGWSGCRLVMLQVAGLVWVVGFSGLWVEGLVWVVSLFEFWVVGFSRLQG